MKVWIYKGEVIGSRSERQEAALAAARAPKAPSRGPARGPRTPRGEVTRSNVADAPAVADAVEAPVVEGGSN